MAKRARLKDISDALNLSITTVSRALNNKSDISQATKKKVLEVAEILNYRPNYFAKYLSEEHNNILGIIVPRVDHSFFSSMIDGMMSKAQEMGYFVLIAESLDDRYNEELILNRFLDLKVEGILLSPAHDTVFADSEGALEYSKHNVVLVDRSFTNVDCPQITNNHYEGAKLAVNHLYDQGYKNIAHIRGLKNDPVAADIYNGFCDAHRANDSEEIMSHLCDVVTPEAGYNAMAHFMLQPTIPDAIFAISDEAALGVYRYCYEHDLSIPEDIGVIGYSNANFTKFLTPSLSTIEQHSHDMGVHAIEVLTKTSKKSQYTSVFDCTLIERESTLKK